MVRLTMAASTSHKPAPPLARFWSDSRGNFATMAAVLIVPLVMLAGGATDYARSASAKTEVQQALDHAVMEVVRLPADQRQAKGVLAFRAVPLRLTQADDPVFSTDPTNGRVSAVTLARVPTAFLSMAGIPRLLVRVEAGAGVSAPQVGRCMTLLSGTTATIASFDAVKLSSANCLFDFQSTATPTFTTANLSTSDLCVRSGTVTNTGSTLTNLRTSCTASQPAAPATPAPAAVTVGACPASGPTVINGGVSYSSTTNTYTYTGGRVTFPSGTYCGNYIFNSGTAVTLTGTVVIKLGSWTLNGGSLTGSGVTIHFTDAAGFNLNTLTSLNLSAPTSGTQQGVLFSESTNAAYKPIINISTRPASSTLSGLIYLPTRELRINTAGSNSDALTMVLRNVNLDNVTNWTIQPFTTSSSGTGTGGSGAPSYLTS